MMKTIHKIICCDSRNLESIEDQSVDLIVTSPPYPMIEMWDNVFECMDETIKTDINSNPLIAFEKMHLCLDKVWSECNRVLKDNGFACINIGDATRTVNGVFSLYSNHSRIIKAFEEMGFYTLPDILWRKQSNAPNKFMGSGMLPAGAYVTYEHEYILIFRKGKKRNFDKKASALRRESAIFWEERNVWFSDLWDNIKGTSQKMLSNDTRERNASYPFEIPYRLINMYSIKGDTVLDPFGGLSTTTIASIASQRNSISVDIDSVFCKQSKDRILNSLSMVNRYIENRIKNHNVFIESLPKEKIEKCYFNVPMNCKVKTGQETQLKIQQINSISCENNDIIAD